MQPTKTTRLLKKIYPEIMGFLKFRWILVSIFLGLVTSWLIKVPITPLLLGGKSFDGRSLLYQIVILIVYVFFTSIIFFCALIMVSLLSIKWGKTSFYPRADEGLKRFTRYFFLNSRISEAEQRKTILNIKEQTRSHNSTGLPYEKKDSFNLVNWLKSYWIYIVIYVFFLYVSTTTARTNDDWEFYRWYQNGFLSTLAEMMRATTYINGRVASLFWGSFFAYYNYLWRFAAPAFFTCIIYLSARLFGYANRPSPVGISFLMLLSISNEIRIQTYTYLIGNIGYIPVIALILLYLNIIYNENTDQKLQLWQDERLNNISLALLAFLIGLWVENVTVGFAAANILLAIMSYLKTGKISPYIRYGIAGCVLSWFVLFGSLVYIGKNKSIGTGIEQLIAQNFPYIIKILVIENLPIYLLFFLIFIILIATGKLGPGSKVARGSILVTSSSIAMIISARIILQFIFEKWYLPVGDILNHINTIFFDIKKPFSIVFCFTILLFVLIAVFLSSQKEKLLVLYSVAVVSAGTLVIAPYLPERAFVLAIFMVAAITAHLSSMLKIKSIDLRKAALMGLIVATSLQMEKFFFNGLYVKQVETIRLQLIESYRERVAGGLTAENELLILPAFKAGTVYYKDAAGFYTNSFNTYYHLPVGAKVVFDDGFAVKSFSVTQVKGSLYRLEVIPLSDKAKYTYTFFIAHDGITVYKSAEKTENFDTVEVPAYPGTYTFQCILSTKTNGQRLINAIESLKIDGK